MNFGLHSASSGRRAQHGRAGQVATCSPRGDRNEFRSTLRQQWASRATRQSRTSGNVFSTRRPKGISVYTPPAVGVARNTAEPDKWQRVPHAATEMNFGLHSASSGRRAQHGRAGQVATCSPRGDRKEFRSTLRQQWASRATRQSRTSGNVLSTRRPKGISVYTPPAVGVARNTAEPDKWQRALHAATEMNFGLHSASSGRRAQHGRAGQVATCSPRGDRNEFRSTLRQQWASRATRQSRTSGNVSERCSQVRCRRIYNGLFTVNSVQITEVSPDGSTMPEMNNEEVVCPCVS
jgi:hypothetical protein